MGGGLERGAEVRLGCLVFCLRMWTIDKNQPTMRIELSWASA